METPNTRVMLRRNHDWSWDVDGAFRYGWQPTFSDNVKSWLISQRLIEGHDYEIKRHRFRNKKPGKKHLVEFSINFKDAAKAMLFRLSVL